MVAKKSNYHVTSDILFAIEQTAQIPQWSQEGIKNMRAMSERLAGGVFWCQSWCGQQDSKCCCSHVSHVAKNNSLALTKVIVNVNSVTRQTLVRITKTGSL